MATDGAALLSDVMTEKLHARTVEQIVLGQQTHFIVDVHVIAVGAHGAVGDFMDLGLNLLGVATGAQHLGELVLEADFEAVETWGIYVGDVVRDDLVTQHSYVEQLVEQVVSIGSNGCSVHADCIGQEFFTLEYENEIIANLR
jgi:hypothetical protein